MGGSSAFPALAEGITDFGGGGAALGIADALGGAAEAGLGASAAAAAPLAWIICTELMRQDRMPKRWYLAGYPVFGAYPEIGKPRLLRLGDPQRAAPAPAPQVALFPRAVHRL